MSAMERGMILANYNDAKYTIVQLLVSQLPDRLMKLESREIIISCAYLWDYESTGTRTDTFSNSWIVPEVAHGTSFLGRSIMQRKLEYICLV